MRVPRDQVAVARERYDGLLFQNRFLHVSSVQPHLQGCKRCLQFGHTVDVCLLLPRSAPKSASLAPEHEALSSIQFAKEWDSEYPADEWPTQVSEVEPPCKRKRSEESEMGIKTTDKSKLNIEKDLLKTLREAGTAVLNDCRFELVSPSDLASFTSRVTCGTCKAVIMVKSVQAHLQSKTHQRAAKQDTNVLG